MMKMIGKMSNAIAFIGHFGLKHFVIELYNRMVDHYYERRLNVDTQHMITKEALGIEHADSVDYVPMRYAPLYSVLKELPVNKQESTFLDYGAGKGRAVIVAATLPFKRVLGIEISDPLVRAAERNIEKMKRRKALSVEVRQGDAALFRVPGDVNVIYFFNPFKGKLLEQVIANVHTSYDEYPRKIHIVFFNNDFFERILTKHGWLIKTGEKRYMNYSCGIYETLPPVKT